MGFSLKSIGRFIDGAYEVKREVSRETSKKIDKNLKKVGRFVDDNYKYLNAVDNVICDTASCLMSFAKQLIDLLLVKDEVKKKCPDAIRAQILAKKQNAVDVGIFRDGKISQKMTIESEVGISSELYKGLIIDLRS